MSLLPHWPGSVEVRSTTLEFREDTGDDGPHLSGYLSVFNEEDSYGDTVLPGAFKRTIRERRGLFPFLWQHDAADAIGVLTAEEDDHGLLIQAAYTLEVQRAREARALAKAGSVTGLSQGFEPVKAEGKDRKEGGRWLKEVRLWEGSQVTFPALASAQIVHVRRGDAAPLTADDVRRIVDEVLGERDERQRSATLQARIHGLRARIQAGNGAHRSG